MLFGIRRAVSGMTIMMNVPFATLIVILGAASSQGCLRNNVKCPDYTVLQSNENYQERQYPPLTWVSTSAPADSRNEVSRSLIKRLYDYLGGDNDKGANVEMMVPVRTAKIPYGSTFNYTMSVLVALNHSDNLPIPTSDLLTVDKDPQTVYYVRSFGGMARQESLWDREADFLKNFLEEQGKEKGSDIANTHVYYRCAYDSPWRETDRLNEVWFKKVTSA